MPLHHVSSVHAARHRLLRQQMRQPQRERPTVHRRSVGAGSILPVPPARRGSSVPPAFGSGAPRPLGSLQAWCRFRGRRSLREELRGRAFGRPRQPGFDDQVPEHLRADLFELHEHRREPIEVRRREKDARRAGEQHLFGRSENRVERLNARGRSSSSARAR